MPRAEIETDRLRVRSIRAGDAPALLAYYERNRAHLKAWEATPPPGFFTLRYWERFVADWLLECEAGTRARFAAFARDGEASSGEILALVNLHGIQRGVRRAAVLGYSVDVDAQGKGLAREAVAAVVRYGFDDLRLHRIEANYQPTNERSGRLLRALGFVVEGYARDYLYLDGAWRDHILTSLTHSH